MITPFIINFFIKKQSSVNNTQIELIISQDYEKLFGRNLTETLLSDFIRQNPDLQIKLSYPADENDREPDILIFDEGSYSALAAVNMLAPLEAYLDFDAGSDAMPLVYFMDLLFYNIDLLQTAGFDRPPKTRDEFIAYAKSVSAGKRAYGAAWGLSPRDRHAVSRDIFSWIWADGGDFWPAGNGPVINTRPLIFDISFFGSVYRGDILAPLDYNSTGDQHIEEFAQGRIAMIVASTRAIPYLREKMGDGAFGVTTIPVSGAAGKYSISLFGYYAAVNADCPYPDAAFKFLSFLAGKKKLLCEELKAVPGDVSSLFYADYMKDDPFYSKARDIFESSNIVRGFSHLKEADEYENIFRDELMLFFATTRTAQETAAAIQRRWDEIKTRW